MDGADEITHDLARGRRAYVHVARGRVRVNGEALQEGDALKISDEARVELAGASRAEVLLFDLA
jgi:hypothetical protein